MIKKVQDKKKKLSSTSSLFIKVNDRTDKLSLKFALNLCVPKPTPISINSKQAESLKTLKFATATPKPMSIKKSVK